MSNYYLTVDTGGSKTHFVLFSECGEKLSESYCAGVGAAKDAENETLPEFEEAAKRVIGNYHISRCVVNLGGKNEKQLYNCLIKITPDAKIEIFRESSGVLANALRVKYMADSVVLYGTGVIIISHGKDGFFIADGWGRDIGDAGSGYYIGLEAIRRSLCALEKEHTLSPLEREITKRETAFSASENVSELMTKRDEVRKALSLPLDRATTAAYAKRVCFHAENGDNTAVEIMRDAGIELAKSVIRALDKAKAPKNAVVLLIGGLCKAKKLWGEGFEKQLREEYENFGWFTKDCDLTEGAFQYIIEGDTRI